MAKAPLFWSRRHEIGRSSAGCRAEAGVELALVGDVACFVLGEPLLHATGLLADAAGVGELLLKVGFDDGVFT